MPRHRDDGRYTVPVKLPDDLRRALKIRAALNDTSISHELEKLVRPVLALEAKEISALD
jgi:plasmid stability protein